MHLAAGLLVACLAPAWRPARPCERLAADPHVVSSYRAEHTSTLIFANSALSCYHAFMWNTGARNIGNGFDFDIHIVDGENSSRHIYVPSRTARMWDGTIFPWVDNDTELNDKAFVVVEAASHRHLYSIFQERSTDGLAYYKWPVVAPNVIVFPQYSERVSVGVSMGGGQLAPVSNADIFIMKSHVWGMPAGNNVASAQQLLDEVLA